MSELITKRIENLSGIYRSLAKHHPKAVHEITFAGIPEQVFNSNAIENSTLTLKDTEDILIRGQILRDAEVREVYEAKNLARVMELLVENPHQNLTVEMILALHHIVLSGINDSVAGRFRSGDEWVRVGTHVGANPKFVNDLVYKLVKDEPVFGQKLTYNKLCNLNSNIVDHKAQNESFSEDESIYNNFCLSAYNVKNNKILSQFNKKFDCDVKIMRHISSYTKFKDKKKLINRSESFDNFRYDYLNLRKTIGEFKKYEYQEIIDRLNKKKENKEDENRIAMKFKDPLVQKINNIRYRRQKVLGNALMNPSEDNTFPRYFLPRTANSLISKNEPPPARKKKRRGRR